MKGLIELQRPCASRWSPKCVARILTGYITGSVVNLVKVFIVALILSANALGDVVSVEDLPPDKLVSIWEAIIQRQGLVGPGVYQMHFTIPTSAYFVAVWPGASRPLFVGRLVSSELSKGHLKLAFAAVEGSESDYDSIEIDGRATYSSHEGAIDGEIVVKSRNGKISTDRVIFLNRLWTHSIAEASKEARKIIEDAESEHRPGER